MTDRDDFGAFLIGLVVGGVAGAVAALLLAPQSGEETRTLIKDKSIELRDKAVHSAEDAWAKAEALAEDAKVKAEALTEEARERGKVAVEGVKKAVAKKRPSEA